VAWSDGDGASGSRKISLGTVAEYMISNTAYASSWNGITTVGASKDAIYDKIESLAIDDLTDAETDASNVFLGSGSGGSITTGFSNVGVGIDAGGSISTGYLNVGVGRASLRSNVSGNSNTALGSNTLELNTVSGNTAVGSLSLAYNTTGEYNSTLGASALGGNRTGSLNVAIGGNALGWNTDLDSATSVGVGSLYYLDRYAYEPGGHANTALGAYAGSFYINGAQLSGISQCTFLGAMTTSGEYSNSTAVGYGSSIFGSNQIALGNENVTDVYIGENGQADITCDDIDEANEIIREDIKNLKINKGATKIIIHEFVK
jgi:hypothetical protein